MIQRLAVRANILDFDLAGEEAGPGGEYFHASQAEVFENLLNIKVQAVADDDQTEALAPTAGDHFRKARA